MYELVCGNIFDRKCDMIIVPCNNNGGVRRSVLNDLAANGIPYNVAVREAGDVAFLDNLLSVTSAHTVGFAASVNVAHNGDGKAYLQSICSKIIRYCRENSLCIVNLPLLGAGSGGLSFSESYQILKEQFQDEDGILGRIFTLSENVYDELAEKKQIKRTRIKNPRVFISYTGENPANREWVKAFTTKLRQNGVNARVDLFHLKPGHDLPQWMTNELIMADKVLLICDKYYVEKADSRKGGVGWEAMIIQGDLLSQNHSDKYLCIVREESIDQAMPIFMKSRYALQWVETEIAGEKFEELLYFLFDCNLEPEMGPVPQIIYDKKAQEQKSREAGIA